jgi:hypothetical protein
LTGKESGAVKLTHLNSWAVNAGLAASWKKWWGIRLFGLPVNINIAATVIANGIEYVSLRAGVYFKTDYSDE